MPPLRLGSAAPLLRWLLLLLLVEEMVEGRTFSLFGKRGTLAGTSVDLLFAASQ